MKPPPTTRLLGADLRFLSLQPSFPLFPLPLVCAYILFPCLSSLPIFHSFQFQKKNLYPASSLGVFSKAPRGCTTATHGAEYPQDSHKKFTIFYYTITTPTTTIPLLTTIHRHPSQAPPASPIPPTEPLRFCPIHSSFHLRLNSNLHAAHWGTPPTHLILGFHNPLHLRTTVLLASSQRPGTHRTLLSRTARRVGSFLTRASPQIRGRSSSH